MPPQYFMQLSWPCAIKRPSLDGVKVGARLPPTVASHESLAEPLEPFVWSQADGMMMARRAAAAAGGRLPASPSQSQAAAPGRRRPGAPGRGCPAAANQAGSHGDSD